MDLPEIAKLDTGKHIRDYDLTNEVAEKRTRIEGVPSTSHTHKIIPFHPRGTRHPNKYTRDNSQENFMPSLISGEDSDFLICIKGGCIRTHKIVLKTCLYFKSNMRLSNEASMQFAIAPSDDAVMDVLECLYSRGVGHMEGCSTAELTDLVNALAFLAADNVIEQLAHWEKKKLEILWDKFVKMPADSPTEGGGRGKLVEELITHVSALIFMLGHYTSHFISAMASHHTNMRSIHAILCRILLGKINCISLEQLDRVTLQAFCEFSSSTMDELVKELRDDADMRKVFRYISMWTGCNLQKRISHTVKLLRMLDLSQIFGVVHDYSKDPLLMLQSRDLVLVFPTRENYGTNLREIRMQLQLVLTELDRDAILLKLQSGNPQMLPANVAEHYRCIKK